MLLHEIPRLSVRSGVDESGGLISSVETRAIMAGLRSGVVGGDCRQPDGGTYGAASPCILLLLLTCYLSKRARNSVFSKQNSGGLRLANEMCHAVQR